MPPKKTAIASGAAKSSAKAAKTAPTSSKIDKPTKTNKTATVPKTAKAAKTAKPAKATANTASKNAAPTNQAPKSTSKVKRTAAEADDTEEAAPPAKKQRAAASGAALAGRKRKASEEPKPRANKRRSPPPMTINRPPEIELDVYVFGEGSGGELGLGTFKTAMNVKRPRLNHLLAPHGVVQVAVGGMHAAALTKDNRILTWGVNDQGALGRDTTWDGGMRDVDAQSDCSDDSDMDSGLNPKESEPGFVDPQAFPEGTILTSVAAGDSATFATTADGSVYGWGTFRNNEGILGFSRDVFVQKTPVLIPELTKITQLAVGDNHALALNDKGHMFAWGAGQQNQLGRRVVERNRTNGLVPRDVGARRVRFTSIACGAFHSFATDNNGKVWSWGLNSYGQTGVEQGVGNDEATVVAPAIVKSLKDYEIVNIDGGAHHSIAVTKGGDCLVWGRCDGCQMGVKIEDVPSENIIHDDNGRPRIVSKPIKVSGFQAAMATASTDTCIAITTSGRAHSWGFSANYQTGQGTNDDVELATLIDNTATRDKKLNWAGAGGQFSILTAPKSTPSVVSNGTHAGAAPLVNGVHS
ncbi:MAG: hypothetical protein M1817_002834 [Caeruleum heppii]|nr:MAG: hypothetical protein M1817_002834 [Caeruleum heppii]